MTRTSVPGPTPWRAAIVGASGPPHPLVTTLRRAARLGSADVVSLELWVDAAPWEAMLTSGEWRRLPVLLSVLPLLDGALQRPTVRREAHERERRVSLFDLEIAPEAWSTTSRADAEALLAEHLVRAGGTPEDEARRLAVSFLSTTLAPWPRSVLLSSASRWCDFFLGNPRDLSLMALGADGAVNTLCATDAA